ncbi:LacI family DNA-binding transcriptional regulator [Pedobacter sp. MW01-1-1]|uniref:LacI family DNA-binding transcriptional regulator n=1 Tax=Pedobacter sp. MW01-1-1 TaxID=3383027 RepID=UPI003FEE159E
MKKKILLKDLANRLNMSITTISFVVNGRAREKNISDATIKRVLDLVHELEYQPNTLATSLRTGKTKTLGFLVDDISEPFFSGIARFIDEKAAEMGYKILFSSTRNDTKKGKELLQIFQDRHVDGYIIALPVGLERDIELLIETGVPVVLFDRYVPGLKSDYVIIDNHAAVLNATQHLINNGYINIAFVTAFTEQQQMIDRMNGYLSAMEQKGLKSTVITIDYGVEKSGQQQVTDALWGDEKYDAVIFAANYICLDGLRAFRDAGKDIYKDLAVLSFDDFELLSFSRPAVTAVAQPLEEIAENVMKIMMSRLHEKDVPHGNKQIVLPANLIVRGSSLVKNK